MKPILKVLLRCLPIEFYKQNVAFFGLIFLILFGFIKASEHLAIGTFLVANSSTLVFLYLLWIAYSIKIFLFANSILIKKKNSFLEVFYLLKLRIKTKAILIISLFFLFPTIAYAAFLIAIATSFGFTISIISIATFLSFNVITLSVVLINKLDKIHYEKRNIEFRLLRKIAIPSWLFFIAYLLRKEPVLLILSKAYSCLIIIGTAALYHTDQFDLRVLSTGILLSFVGNSAILHKYIWFVYQRMQYALNMPQSFLGYWSTQFATITLLLMPEIIALIRYYPIDPVPYDIIGVLFFGVAINVLIFALLLMKQQELSDFMSRVFWLIIISTFLILFSIHPLIMAFLYIFIATTMMYFHRFKFEFLE